MKRGMNLNSPIYTKTKEKYSSTQLNGKLSHTLNFRQRKENLLLLHKQKNKRKREQETTNNRVNLNNRQTKREDITKPNLYRETRVKTMTERTVDFLTVTRYKRNTVLPVLT